MKKPPIVKVYKSGWHLAITLAFIVTPFLFLLIFSKVAGLNTSQLFGDLGISFIRLLIAYIIAITLAWILAASFFRGKRALIALPLFDVLQSFPTFAALPIVVYFLGESNLTVIIFLVVTIIGSMLFPIVSSLKLIRFDWEDAVKIYDVRGWNYVKKFLLPVSVPGLITGSILGLGNGWQALIATEIIVQVKSGLGPFFNSFSSNFTVTAFGILGFLILIFSINRLVWLPLLEKSHRRMEE
jgi:NitT/TauT family transport system permease protein